MRKIPAETNSFQAVLLPFHPDRFPHQMDDRTCWQIGCATNYTEKHRMRDMERQRSVKLMSSPPCVWLVGVSPSSYLLLVVVDGKPQTGQVGYTFLEGLLL